jgi:DNA gyrase subunit A
MEYALLINRWSSWFSVDGDSPAAMRYTEARMRKILKIMADIEKKH